MSFSRKPLAGVSILALAAALPFATAQVAETALVRKIAASGATADAVHVSALKGTVEISGLKLANSVTAERIIWSASLPGLVGPALAQSGGFTVEGLKLGSDAMTVTIPRITVDGSSIGKDDLGKLFVADAGLPDRMRTISASAIRAPEISFRIVTKQSGRTEYTLKDVVAENIVNGKIGRIATGDSPYLSDAPGMKQDGVIKSMEMRGFDLGQSAHIWFGKAKVDEKPAPIYDSYVMSGMTSRTTGAVPMEMTFGKVQGNVIRMRPLVGNSLSEMIGELIAMSPTDMNAGKDSKPEDRAKLAKTFAAFADLMDAFEDEGTIGENMQIKIEEGGSKPAATFSIAKFAGTYGNAKTPSTFMLSDINMAGGGATARLAQFGITGFSYAPMLRGLAEMMAKPDFDSKNPDVRKMMPRLGQIVIKGFEVDAPDPKAPKGVKPERINLKLGQFLFDTKNQVMGIPTDVTLGFDNLALKLPQNSSEEGIKLLKALGYNAVDLSARIAAKWDESAKEIAITDVSVGGAGMGTAKLTAKLGNIGRDVFEADTSMMQVALMGATAKSVTLKVDNTGLAEKALVFQARQQGRKPEELRTELGTMAQMAIPMMLGPSDEAKTIAGALAKFAVKTKSLSIDLTAKNAGGIGIPDIATVGDPSGALKLVNVKASASD